MATDDIINIAERDATVTVTGTNESGAAVTLNGNATTVVDATHWSYNLSSAAITVFGDADGGLHGCCGQHDEQHAQHQCGYGGAGYANGSKLQQWPEQTDSN